MVTYSRKSLVVPSVSGPRKLYSIATASLLMIMKPVTRFTFLASHAPRTQHALWRCAASQPATATTCPNCGYAGGTIPGDCGHATRADGAALRGSGLGGEGCRLLDFGRGMGC